jgi:F-type H+-transporting ATPase subunit epsilon
MEEKILDIEIVTPQKIVYSGKAHTITVPGSQSPFQVLFNHAPIVSTLDEGIIKLVDETEKIHLIKISKGFVEVPHNHVSIVVESAEEQNSI